VTRIDQWRTHLDKRLGLLTLSRQICFAAGCCERLFPAYLDFYREEKWGDPAALKQGIILLWNSVAEEKPNQSVVRDITRRIDAALPHTEKFNSKMTPAALDSGTSIAESLEFLQDHDTRHLLTVAELALDSADRVAQRAFPEMQYTDPRFEQSVATHPAVVKELDTQREQLQFLELADQTFDLNVFRRRFATHNNK
jgi:uncharacterized protein YjaG (DUF416 family)